MLIGAAFNAAIDRRWPQRLDDYTLDGTPTTTTGQVVPLVFDRDGTQPPDFRRAR
jgi:hypothetical protein